MSKQFSRLVFLSILVGSFCFSVGTESRVFDESRSHVAAVVPIGMILDMDGPLGSMVELCMDMAVEDFYARHPNYSTRLQLHKKSAASVLDANLAALELLDQNKVQGIIGAQQSTKEVAVLAELGQKVHIPIISLLPQASPLQDIQNHYDVRIAVDNGLQTQALAAICKTFQWHEVAMLYEDSDYGYQFLSYMSTTLQEVEISMAFTTPISSSVSDSGISDQLRKITMKQTRVLLVHMNPTLSLRLFNIARKEELMSKGYAWLITDSLSIFIHSMDSSAHDSLEGVIGIRPYVNPSKEFRSFKERYNRNVILKSRISPVLDLNIYGLWAYDVAIALATIVEKITPANFTSEDVTKATDGLHNTSLGISQFGTTLLNELLHVKFSGLSGHLEFIDGKIKPSGFEIFNVIGSGEKIIGYWTPDKGIQREWNSTGKTKGLKNVMWPGDSTMKPKGWDIPMNLRVGIPRRHGFSEFVSVKNNSMNPTGFSIDIFQAALSLLPFQVDYEFRYFNTGHINWSYDDMLKRIPEDFDMVVGDTTIWAPRTSLVDFSTPYSESGVALVVKNKKPFDMWIFVKPLSWDLWLVIIVACILLGIVLRIMERRVSHNEADSIRMHEEHQPGMIYWSPVAVLAFPERDMVSNRWSFIVLVFWMFMAFILMQSYTANLSAILTVDQLKFAFSDNYYIGYQEGSFMKTFLMKQMHISESKLRKYTSAEEFDKAMSLGSKNGGIDAIFDEIPYMKIFLNKYDSKYKMVGPTYRTGGFGFAFHIGSPLVMPFSKAILNITQGPNITALEQQNFGPGYSSLDPLSSKISQQTSSLTVFDFGGLFIIIGSVMVSALFCSETALGQGLTRKIEHCILSLFNAFKTSNDTTVSDYASDADDLAELSGEENGEHELSDNSASVNEEGAAANVVRDETIQHGNS